MKSTVFVLSTILFCSCSKIDGTIEKRTNDEVYLVNKSVNKQFKFTVKTTTLTNDSSYSYEIRFIELAPGDEFYLGKTTSVSKPEYPLIDAQVLKYYKPKKRPTLPGMVELDAPSFLLDTLNYVRLIFPDGSIAAIKKTDAKNALEGGAHILKDTIVNAEKVERYYTIEKVKDSLHPLPLIHYAYKYEVTGQVEIKFKPKTEKSNDQ